MTSTKMAELASTEQMLPDAAVQATRSVEIDAPPAKVWSVLTAVPRWQHWYPYLKNAHLEGPFKAGSKLTYGGSIKHNLALAKVDEGRLVMIYGTLVGYTAITRWDIDRIGDARTKVSFTETSDGFLLGTLYSDEKLGKHLQDWLDKLKEEAERS